MWSHATRLLSRDDLVTGCMITHSVTNPWCIEYSNLAYWLAGWFYGLPSIGQACWTSTNLIQTTCLKRNYEATVFPETAKHRQLRSFFRLQVTFHYDIPIRFSSFSPKLYSCISTDFSRKGLAIGDQISEILSISRPCITYSLCAAVYCWGTNHAMHNTRRKCLIITIGQKPLRRKKLSGKTLSCQGINKAALLCFLSQNKSINQSIIMPAPSQSCNCKACTCANCTCNTDSTCKC